MRYLKKINKGVVLTIIVIGILVIYLIGVEAKRNAEKPNIEKVVKDYFSFFNEYSVLPADNQKLETKIKNEEEAKKIDEKLDSEIKDQLERFEENVKTRMIDNKTAIDIQKGILEGILSEGNDLKQSITTKYNREITKIKKYEFDENQVTVTFDSNIEIEIKYLDSNNKERIKKDTQKNQDESITLNYENESWKVVYTDLISKPIQTFLGF